MRGMYSAPPFTFNELVLTRAQDPETKDKVMVRFGEAAVTYSQFLDRCVAWSHLFLSLRRNAAAPPKVAVLMKNNLDYLYAFGGCAFSGGTLFALNTGLGGDVLARVINKSGAEILLVDAEHRPAVFQLHPQLEFIRGNRLIEVMGDSEPRALAELRASSGNQINEPPEVDGLNAMTPWMVIYTSGTTGLPKGIVNHHGKLRAIGHFTAHMLGLRPDDVGYICMPLFHSNAHYLNWLPAMTVGATVVLREKFSASGFLDDVFSSGATYWNYVGQPVHYVLEAVSRRFDGDESKILGAVCDDPRNKLRLALGTGASGKQRARFMKWFGLEHFYEMYGSTEAEIATCCRPGDPLDSVGEITDEAVVVVRTDGSEAAPSEMDAEGNVGNYKEAVGEIVRRGNPTGLFQGYHNDPDATSNKYRDGIFHSGDLGMVRLLNGRRYLYFVGRTDDWIRKDGENFTAESVVDMISGHPDVELAAAYGAPNPVSDESVMVAVKMRDGRPFDPKDVFEFCEREVGEKGRDRKWFPDFVRVVDDFPFTETHKIIVRQLKGDYYHPGSGDGIYFRTRGDRTFRRFGAAEFEELKREFSANGRAALLI